jgi:hypothetical protein
MNKLKPKGVISVRCCFAKTVGVAAFAFGAGVLLCLVMPSGALLFVESSLIVGAGALLFIK